MFTRLRRRLANLLCTHRPAFPAGASAVIKETKWDDVRNCVNRRALCAMCGATWENIPDWAAFKPSPGRPKPMTPSSPRKPTP